MNESIRSRLISLAVQSEEQAKEYRMKAQSGARCPAWAKKAIFWEGMAEQAEKRAARCRARVAEDSQSQSDENRSEAEERHG